MRILNKKSTISTDEKNFMEKSLSFIREGLEEAAVNRRLAVKAEMLSDEMIAAMLPHATGDHLNIRIRRFFGDTVINISMKGEECDLFEHDGDPEETDDYEREEVIRSILLRAYGENLNYIHKKGINRVTIKAGGANRSMMKSTVIALAFALLFGMLMKIAMPEAAVSGICDYVLIPFRTMFMNALQMVIGPVVFFSIVTCLSQFRSIAELGKIGIKIMGTYLFTTVVAVAVSMAAFFVFSPGENGAALNEKVDSEMPELPSNVDTSLLHTIIDIVPSNFVKPFLENNTLQIIFLAFICGIAVGMIGEHSRVLKELFEACNSLFLTITTIVARFIPVAVFCSVTLMMVQMGGKSFLSLLSVFMTHSVAIAAMLVIYGLLITVAGRLDPIRFFRKIRGSMVTSLVLMSSSAAMPTNLKTCTEKLGISPKVANFSIPLGATINMDGSCVFLTTFGLYLAKMYGIEVDVFTVLSLAITIILLSLGAPGVPGSSLVCLGIVLGQLGVPVEGIGLIMAINPFLDMLVTMSNVTGDITTTAITARSEGLLDLDIYNS